MSLSLTLSDWATEFVPITADSAGWRKWCEENPDKCGGQPTARRTAKGVDTIKEALLRDGGFTINPRTGELVTTGYSVAIANHSSITAAKDFLEGDNAQRAIDEWLEREGATFDSDPELNLGGWYDREHDEIVLDPSKNIDNEAEAVALGRQWDQQAIYDHVNNREIPTGGSGQRAASMTYTAAAWEQWAITADTEGWRKWCEANPDKCGGGSVEKPPTEGPTKVVGADLEGEQLDREKFDVLMGDLREGADIPEAHYSTTGAATREAFDFTDAKNGPLGPEGKVKIADYQKGPIGMGQQRVEESVRDPSHVYRAVSEADYARISESGELSSDTRGAISSDEGMNAGMDPETAFSYLPRGGVDGSTTGVIMRIKFDPADGWFAIKADGYPRTRQAIPLSKVDMITRPIEHRADEKGMKFPWMAAVLTADAWLQWAILADSEGWRRWCEANPEKCEYVPKGREITDNTAEVMYAGRNVDDGLLFLPMWVDDLEQTGADRNRSLSKEHQQALTSYTRGANKLYNEELRSASPSDRALEAAAAIEAASIDLVDDEGNPPFVYRGIQVAGATEENLTGWFPVGQMVSTTGIMSTTLSTPTAIRMADRYMPGQALPVVMEIEARRGASLQSLTKYPDEHEIAFGPGTKLRITGIETRTARYSNAELDELDNEEAPAAPDTKMYIVRAEQVL